jgi:hypothetical protein
MSGYERARRTLWNDSDHFGEFTQMWNRLINQFCPNAHLLTHLTASFISLIMEHPWTHLSDDGKAKVMSLIAKKIEVIADLRDEVLLVLINI